MWCKNALIYVFVWFITTLQKQYLTLGFFLFLSIIKYKW
jgi:hypothetical protein